MSTEIADICKSLGIPTRIFRGDVDRSTLASVYYGDLERADNHRRQALGNLIVEPLVRSFLAKALLDSMPHPHNRRARRRVDYRAARTTVTFPSNEELIHVLR